MIADESWTVAIDGVAARVSRTRLFFGTPRRVLVAHFEGPRALRYLAFTDALDRAAFEAWLATFRFVG